jgi:uncharacterized protein with HEPN domain
MRTDDLYLVDLIDADDDIAATVAGMDAIAFAANREKRNAVLWGLVVIGEAAVKLSPKTRGEMANVPWDQVRAFRNRMIHGYFTLQWPIVWDIAALHLPPMRAEAIRILQKRFPLTFQSWEHTTRC